jgi:hypothetical protein
MELAANSMSTFVSAVARNSRNRFMADTGEASQMIS